MRYEFLAELDLANVVVKDENADECTRPPTKYSLRAVIVHMGSAQMAFILKSLFYIEFYILNLLGQLLVPFLLSFT